MLVMVKKNSSPTSYSLKLWFSLDTVLMSWGWTYCLGSIEDEYEQDIGIIFTTAVVKLGLHCLLHI